MTQATRTVSQTSALRSGATLTVDNHKGSCHMIPWDREEVEVVARIEAPAYLAAEWAVLLVDATRIELAGDGAELTVAADSLRAPAPPGEERAPTPIVHYEIRAPRALRFFIRDHESDIEIGGFSGAVEIATHKGTVHLAGFRGELEIRTHKGAVELEDVVIEDDSWVRSFKGRISFRMARPQGLSLTMNLAKKAIFHGDFGGRAHEQAGGELETPLAGGGPRLRIESQGGEVWLRCPSPDEALV